MTGKTSFIKTVLSKNKFKGNINPTILIDIKKASEKNINLIIWDCGGQEQFLKVYHKSVVSEELVYGARVLCYFFDAADDKRLEKAIDEFKWIKNLFEIRNPEGKIYCFINKADLVNYSEEKFSELRRKITSKVGNKNIQYYFTSIYKPAELIKIFKKIICS